VAGEIDYVMIAQTDQDAFGAGTRQASDSKTTFDYLLDLRRLFFNPEVRLDLLVKGFVLMA
jgi:hypothetical protein